MFDERLVMPSAIRSTEKKLSPPRLQVYMPVAGIFVFVILYFIAASLYPGGSDIDRNSKGFSWLHNYWCELMASQSQNGQPNTARPVAISAMWVLVISLSLLWYGTPRHLPLHPSLQKLITVCGILSMALLFFLSSTNHDLVINIASSLGIVAILLTSAGLYRKKMLITFALGLLCLLLCILNSWLYYTGQRYYLPVVQKVTFILFLTWFGMMRINV